LESSNQKGKNRAGKRIINGARNHSKVGGEPGPFREWTISGLGGRGGEDGAKGKSFLGEKRLGRVEIGVQEGIKQHHGGMIYLEKGNKGKKGGLRFHSPGRANQQLLRKKKRYRASHEHLEKRWTKGQVILA